MAIVAMMVALVCVLMLAAASVAQIIKSGEVAAYEPPKTWGVVALPAIVGEGVTLARFYNLPGEGERIAYEAIRDMGETLKMEAIKPSTTALGFHKAVVVQPPLPEVSLMAGVLCWESGVEIPDPRPATIPPGYRYVEQRR